MNAFILIAFVSFVRKKYQDSLKKYNYKDKK